VIVTAGCHLAAGLQTRGDFQPNARYPSHAKLVRNFRREVTSVADNKDEGFKVIDRRPFTAEGEIRKEVVEEQEREARREEVKAEAKVAANAHAEAAKPPADTPKRLPAFENLIRMIGSNAAMVLGAYADPNTGQPMIDPDAARELIDMLDALQQKTKGNLAPEEDEMLLDLLGKLKLTYLEVNKAMAAEMAKVTAQAKTGKR
jgi:Domain of unknown function (DUF1844)